MFVGREHELNSLNQHYESNNYECAIIYGRRRIGKTELISEFVKDKPTIFYTATQENEEANLTRMSKAVLCFENPNSLGNASFSSFNDLLEEIGKIAQEKRIVWVIDEYPYLAESYPGFSSLLQKFIDRNFLHSKLFLILCGSSMSFMEKQVLGYQSPLYGRRTMQLKIESFNFHEAQKMLPQVDKQAAFALYAISGGIPQYLSYFSRAKSVKEAIIDNFLMKDGRLFEEPNNLIKQELRDPANYNSIIAAIAQGHSRLNEIATATQIKATSLRSFLSNLSELEIIDRVVPVTEDPNKSKKSVYRIRDGMYRFWYRFVPSRLTLIERGMVDVAWQGIESKLSNFLGADFKKLSQDYLWEHYNPEKTPFTKLGNWWGTDSRTRKQVELDVLAFSTDDTSFAIFGECKWRNEPISKQILEKLIFNSNIFNYPKKYYYLFSKTGFTDECHKLAQEVGCQLITFKEM
ncbi:ATP-binding protein [Lactobacillus ultunensis]|uniref:ATP-binding protein n=1 Tax=Lactobacillus ultunensis TaxID=227945 RepID=UPI0019122C6B|nr:ATP-binding protein [Lactobacillus ultunensis]QQP28330.1 ATP-binding protein [Lactobacillus ultunensis]